MPRPLPPPATRDRLGLWAHNIEGGLYVCLALLLIAGAVLALLAAVATLWNGLRQGSLLSDTHRILEHLLLVLIFVEILHTVRLSIHSQTLVLEPFLVVGLIASVRRILVITMAAQIGGDGTQPAQGEQFRNTMIELGLLGFLILVMAVAIFLLRRSPPSPEEGASTG